jgi:putative transposase
VVDVLGNLLHVQVHAANLHDTMGACEILRRSAEKHPSLQAFSGDAGYRGTAVRYVDELLGLTLHISEKIKDGFAVLPKRWVVERTFAWLNQYRRLSKDYEYWVSTADAMIYAAMVRLMLRRLSRC